jgi:hypothetical protein
MSARRALAEEGKWNGCAGAAEGAWLLYGTG